MSRDDDRPMTLARLRELLEAYGAEPARWPEAERVAAEKLLRTDAEAARWLQEAAALDGLLALDAERELSASAALRARVAEVPLRQASIAGPATGSAGLRAAIGMMLTGAIAVAAGVVAGALVGEDAAAVADTAATVEAESNDQPTTDSGADATEDDGWDELTALAFAADYEGEP